MPWAWSSRHLLVIGHLSLAHLWGARNQIIYRTSLARRSVLLAKRQRAESVGLVPEDGLVWNCTTLTRTRRYPCQRAALQSLRTYLQPMRLELFMRRH